MKGGDIQYYRKVGVRKGCMFWILFLPRFHSFHHRRQQQQQQSHENSRHLHRQQQQQSHDNSQQLHRQQQHPCRRSWRQEWQRWKINSSPTGRSSQIRFYNSVSIDQIAFNVFFKKGGLLLFVYSIQHCFICRPSDSTVSEDTVIKPRTVASRHLLSDTLTTRLDLIHNSAISHPLLG